MARSCTPSGRCLQLTMKLIVGGRAPVVTLWHGWRSEWVDKHEYLLGGVGLLLGVGWAFGRFA
jgi:hypothetical protein